MPINFEANKKGSVCEWVIILSLVTFGIYFNHDIKTTPDNSTCTILKSTRQHRIFVRRTKLANCLVKFLSITLWTACQKLIFDLTVAS
jgi:hypothetical protein